jgi:hypothetical protein
LNAIVSILPSSRCAGRLAGLLAFSGLVMAVLVEYGMKFVESWLQRPIATSAPARLFLPILSVAAAVPVTAWLSGGSATSPRTGPPVLLELGPLPTESTARKGLSKDRVSTLFSNQL